MGLTVTAPSYKATKPHKLCGDCYRAEFGTATPGTYTWGRECTRCHTPTPSRATLVKVDRA
jgi:hypothetical protein